MLLVYKQLTKQMCQNRIFMLLLLLLTTLTSLSFYFVTFSIDGNLAKLNTLTVLTENQQLYKNALNANASLAYTFFVSTVGLTSFVFVLFFYRFYRAAKKQMGCMKALGFKDRQICACVVIFVAVLSEAGAILGLVGGYFLSDVLIHANANQYAGTELVKHINLSSLFIGLVASTSIYCLFSFFCYSIIRGKEAGFLMAGNESQASFSFSLRAANNISNLLPTRHKMALRLALRKPLSILLIIGAVMSFSVCMILGQSLNVSSKKVFDSQTIGHNYEYDTRFSDYQTGPVPETVISYLDNTVRLSISGHEIEQTVTGLYTLNNLYELQNIKGKGLPLPKAGTAYINPGLHEIYGIDIGNRLVAYIEGVKLEVTVVDIAANAKSAHIYLNADELSNALSVSIGAYNGILSMETWTDGIATTKDQRIDTLHKEAVSSNISAVINQSIGGLIGPVFIFLAIYASFGDNTRDMLILHMMGYQTKHIRSMLIDVYKPIVGAAFFLTLGPSILLAKSIQKSLSISTNDYMPFGTSSFVIILVFAGLSVIYWLVQALFGLGIKRIIGKEKISAFIYAE